MASFNNQSPHTMDMNLPSIQSLMSPAPSNALHSPATSPAFKTNRLQSYSPENTLPPLTNICQSEDTAAHQYKTSDTMAKGLPLSPPISPWTGIIHANTFHEKPTIDACDPVLFPNNENESVPRTRLFASKNEEEHAITVHLAENSTKFTGTTPPTREHYRTVVACVGRAYNSNPGAYLKRQREEEERIYHQTKRICAGPGQRYIKPALKPISKPVAIAPRPPRQPRKPLAEHSQVAQSDRPKRALKPTPKASPETPLLDYVDEVPIHSRLMKSLPRSKAIEIAAKTPMHSNIVPKVIHRRSRTPEHRVPGTKPNDIDYPSLPDFSPPLSTLKLSPVALKAEWSSTSPYNNDRDPDRHLLHEAEVKVSETLRLSCAQYLCSKRRIMMARVDALRIGKLFRKTDAQKVCKIDVNKASRLFAAFEKVGWFDEAYFKRFL